MRPSCFGEYCEREVDRMNWKLLGEWQTGLVNVQYYANHEIFVSVVWHPKIRWRCGCHTLWRCGTPTEGIGCVWAHSWKAETHALMQEGRRLVLWVGNKPFCFGVLLILLCWGIVCHSTYSTPWFVFAYSETNNHTKQRKSLKWGNGLNIDWQTTVKVVNQVVP